MSDVSVNFVTKNDTNMIRRVKFAVQRRLGVIVPVVVMSEKTKKDSKKTKKDSKKTKKDT